MVIDKNFLPDSVSKEQQNTVAQLLDTQTLLRNPEAGFGVALMTDNRVDMEYPQIPLEAKELAAELYAWRFVQAWQHIDDYGNLLTRARWIIKALDHDYGNIGWGNANDRITTNIALRMKELDQLHPELDLFSE